MRHAIVYYGRLEENFRSLTESTTTYTKGGEPIEVMHANVDGLIFARMQVSQDQEAIVRAGDVVLEKPIVVVPGRHTGINTSGPRTGRPKGLGPRPTTIDEVAAGRLIEDAAAANPRLSARLLALLK